MTLPVPPRVLDDQNPVKVDEVQIDGVGVVLVSRFRQARTIKLQGSIYTGGTNTYLESTYLAPLRAMARQQVTITDPDSQFSGNWVMGEPDFHREAEGLGVRYTYSISFKQGVGIVVL